MTAKEYKQYKGLRKENLRDNMDNIELILTDLSEEAAKRLAAKFEVIVNSYFIKILRKNYNIIIFILQV